MVNLHAANEVYLSFSADINPSTTESLISAMADCANAGVQRVCLLLSTPGGSVANGLNLYNVLRGMPFRLITHNVAEVSSVGIAVFLAGEERYTVPHARFMFHGVGFTAQPNQRFEEQQLRGRLDSVIGDQKRIGAVITERTDLTEIETAALFGEAQSKDAGWGVSKGIAHEIRQVSTPKGAPTIGLVFKR